MSHQDRTVNVPAGGATGTFVTNGQVRLHYREAGAGSPSLVFVHGGGVDLSTWDEHLDHFAPHHRVVAMDLRGHGQSERAQPYTNTKFRADLAALITELRLAPAVVIGASRGAGIANRVAVDFPGLIQALVFIDYGAAPRQSESTPWAQDPEATHALLRSLAADWTTDGARRLVNSWFPEPGVPEALKERLAGLCRQTDPQVVAEIRLRDLDDTDREEYLRRIAIPTLVLQGTSESHRGREQGQFIAERVPGAALRYFEGRGHGCFMSAPEEFWGYVEEFLGTLNSRRRG
jgi:pimeloyl-ACP methyl ester carboxylesterase